MSVHILDKLFFITAAFLPGEKTGFMAITKTAVAMTFLNPHYFATFSPTTPALGLWIEPTVSVTDAHPQVL